MPYMYIDIVHKQRLMTRSNVHHGPRLQGHDRFFWQDDCN